MTERAGVDPTVPPSGTGCVECEAAGGWWVHLRRCTQCGHIGCCDTSPSQHATAHFHATGHPVITSFEPGEDWFWDFTTDSGFLGPTVCPPTGATTSTSRRSAQPWLAVVAALGFLVLEVLATGLHLSRGEVKEI